MTVVNAYVMVKAHTGDADQLRETIEGIDGVVRAHIVAGDYDLIARAEVDSTADVREVVATQIRGLDGVEDTRTYIAME